MKAPVRLVALVAAVSIVGFGCTTAAATPPPSGAASAASSSAAASAGASATTDRAPTVEPSTAKPSATVPPVKASLVIPHSLIPSLIHNRILYRVDRVWWLIPTNGVGKIKIADDFPQPQMSPGPWPQAVWAADGMKVHYVRFNVADLCRPEVIDANPWTGDRTLVHVALDGGDMHFVWSPDGTKIAFTRSQNYKQCTYTSYGIDDVRDLMMMNADGSGLHTVRTDVPYALTGWMPDGSAIIGDTEAGIVRVNPSTGAATTMIANVVRARVSPDSSRVAYDSGGNLLVRAVAGGLSVNMGPVSAYPNSFAWAPNGHSLIVIRNVSTTHAHPFQVPYPPGLVNDLGADGKAPSWSPDNNHFVCATGGLAKIFNVSGQPFTTIPNTAGAEEVYWQP